MGPVRWLALLACCVTLVQAQEEVDSEESRKVLGSSVVTSVSVIMDHGNGTKTYITDAAGQPVDQTDGSVGSPVDLLNPDRYEFYTFDETGDLVKRLMTLDQIKGLLAGGDDETLDSHSNSPTFYHESLGASHLDDSDLEPNLAQGVHSVVASVQNVLRSELAASKTKVTTSKPLLNIPDSLSSWSMLFPPILSDSSEIDDGNSVNEPIDAGDRLPSPSNEEKTQVKVPQSEKISVTSKPTAVPPIIHFLEIQSVPSPLKSPTKTPENVSTAPVTLATTSAPPSTTTTQKPTSPVNPMQEMSASISSLLSQVTDNKTSTDILTSSENRISISTSSPLTTESTNKVSNDTNTKLSGKNPILIRPLKPESSNVNVVTKNPPVIHTKTESPIVKNKPMKVTESLTNKFSKPSTSPTPATTQENSKIISNQSSTKKTTDAVVSLVTTAKPASLVATKTNSVETIKPKPSNINSALGTKQKLQVTAPPPSLITKNTIKNQPTTQSNPPLSKKPKPGSTTSKPEQGSETLEALSSEGVVKIVPNKPSQTLTVTNKTKTNSQNKTNPIGVSAKPTSKPVKKVPNNKPHVSNDTECENANKTLPQNDLKKKDNLEVAASKIQSEKLKPTKVKTPSLQEIKVAQKPSSQNSKPIINKIKPSEEVKITTYKPSTSIPFTTKHSINKLSTTTEKPIDHKLESASKIHEVNSSLFDIKNHVEHLHNKTETQSLHKLPVLSLVKNNENISNYEGAASSTAETKVPAAIKTNESTNASKAKNNSTEIIDHSTEAECTHSKKPAHTSIQDKISDVSHDFAASNTEEVKLTTSSAEIATEITTEASSAKDVTTDVPMEATTNTLADDLLTTTDPSDEMVTDLPETTTLNMPEMDFVKEGISAVTNILLDTKPVLEQLSMPTLPLSESASNLVQSPPVKGELKHAASFDEMEMTTADTDEEKAAGSVSSTEKELIIYFTSTLPPDEEKAVGSVSSTEKDLNIYFTSTLPPTTETEPPTIEGTSGNKSLNSKEESTEQTPEAETVTPKVDEMTMTTTAYEEKENKEPSESKIISMTAIKQALPTKESKLSPENTNETSLTTEDSVICNHTTVELNKTNDYPTVHNGDKNASQQKENLESAQSAISEVNNTKQESAPVIKSTTPSPPVETTTTKTLKDEPFKLDFKTAQKPDQSIKFNNVKYPNLQSSFRPAQNPVSSNPSTAVELHPAPHESMGLEATTAFLADDVRRFSDLCNELAFRMWTSITGKGSISSRSLVLSPFATTSLLAMVFLGARGPTSGQMNDVLRLDDMVTFNPHQVLQNVTESVLNSRNYGVTTAAFVRELYSDKQKGKIIDFYKERAQQYYDGHVEEISFNNIGDILRRRTNLLVKRQTLGRVPEYLRGSTLSLRPPLAAFSANIFQTDCDLASTEGRDGEMYFVVRPSTRQRRLVPVPAAVWRTGFLAGYEPALDATAVALGTDSVVSTILVLPGQQGQVAPGDGLARLEQRLIETSYRRGGWTRMLRSLLPRPGLELQVPRFSHRSVLNVTSTLQRMGLKDLFNENKADLRGLNGLSNDLHLSDMVQVNTFSTCGEDTIGARHHIETYPVSPQRMGRDDPELYPRPEDFDDGDLQRVPLNLRPRQARLPDNPRLRFDRPFLYMVRHNPTGMILHMGRFNPRLLP